MQILVIIFITILQYKYNIFIVIGGLLQNNFSFGTATVYKCSAETYGEKTNLQFSYAISIGTAPGLVGFLG